MKINKEWNEKYLSGIESVYDKNLITPLKSIPKKYNAIFWKRINASVLGTGMVLSFVFAAINHCQNAWIFEWLSNMFLNLSLGMLASLIILLYTECKEQNVNFYEQTLELFKGREQQLRTAFFASFRSIPRNLSYNKLNEATEDAFNSFECFFAIVNFYEFLYKNFDVMPKPLNQISIEKINEAKKDELELYKKMEAKVCANGCLKKDDLEAVERSGDIIYSILNKFKLWIMETEKSLYDVKYGNTNDTNIGGDKQ